MTASVEQYCYRKEHKSKQRGVGWYLTESDVHLLLYMAGINISQVGNKAGEYCLGRLGDTGDYVPGNCRFITKEQNAREQDMQTPGRVKAHKDREKSCVSLVTGKEYKSIKDMKTTENRGGGWKNWRYT